MPIKGIMMSDLQIYNSLSRKKEKFEPIQPGFVGIYVCGPTVYGHAHLGHAKSYISFDLIVRYLSYLGYKVRYVQNITDVGHMRTDPTSPSHFAEASRDEGLRGAGDVSFDPIIQEALREGKTPQEVASEYTKKFLEDEKALNIIPADVFPKATEHIQEMIELTKSLIEKGFAYPSTRASTELSRMSSVGDDKK